MSKKRPYIKRGVDYSNPAEVRAYRNEWQRRSRAPNNPFCQIGVEWNRIQRKYLGAADGR